LDIEGIYRLAFGDKVQPDRWQRELAHGQWPRVLVAPTGSGKTAAVTLSWAFRRLHSPEVTPRRLVWCLPMRTLAEQTAGAVREWCERLSASDLNGSGALPSADDVHVLMGGVDNSGWLDNPEKPSVIVGTQDMLLSRALMRGYASSRATWPMEFAVLHEDAQWVFDEVQLMGAGRATSAQLEAFRRTEAARAAQVGNPVGLPSRSLWISATLDPTWLQTVDHETPQPEETIRVEPSEEAADRLGSLVQARKELSRAEEVPSSSKATDIKTYIEALADAVVRVHRTGHVTIAIVNRVARAQDLYKAIEKRIGKPGPSTPTLALVHSRFRPRDRDREMAKVVGSADTNVIVVATQAIEAGVDISAAVMFTELAPWASMVQRFGRLNRRAEYGADDPARVYWIDLMAEVAPEDKQAAELARPYMATELIEARDRLGRMTDAAPINLPPPAQPEPSRRVIRRKDLEDLFDTDPDLTGFDVDVSPYVRDADDTDVRVFWRNLSGKCDEPPRPRSTELCAVPIGAAANWVTKVRKKWNDAIFVSDPQWHRTDAKAGTPPPGWKRFTEAPWPGLTLLADVKAGGYDDQTGFTGDTKNSASVIADQAPDTAPGSAEGESEGHGEDRKSEIGVPVTLAAHQRDVVCMAERLCEVLRIDPDTRQSVLRAARWHDIGKAHEVFQDTMRRGLNEESGTTAELLAKTEKSNLRHKRSYFRHELASALAFLAQEGWSRDADLTAYLIAAHHGKVRLNLRALPRESGPKELEKAGLRFARGIWDGDEVQAVELEGGERWNGGSLNLSVMELGWNEETYESWTERTRDLLTRFGPFRLAWMETLLRIADWRASAMERKKDWESRSQ